MKRLVALATALLAAASLHARPVIVTWEHPMDRTDGTILDVTEIAHTRIEYTCGPETLSVDVTSPDAETIIDVRRYGPCSFTAYTVDKFNQSSDASEPYELIVKPARPRRPAFQHIIMVD